MSRKFYIKQAPEMIGLTEYQARRMVKEGKLPAIYSGNRMILDVELCKEYLEIEAIKNVNSAETIINSYGKLRKVEG